MADGISRGCVEMQSTGNPVDASKEELVQRSSSRRNWCNWCNGSSAARAARRGARDKNTMARTGTMAFTGFSTARIYACKLRMVNFVLRGQCTVCAVTVRGRGGWRGRAAAGTYEAATLEGREGVAGGARLFFLGLAVVVARCCCCLGLVASCLAVSRLCCPP